MITKQLNKTSTLPPPPNWRQGVPAESDFTSEDGLKYMDDHWWRRLNRHCRVPQGDPAVRAVLLSARGRRFVPARIFGMRTAP